VNDVHDNAPRIAAKELRVAMLTGKSRFCEEEPRLPLNVFPPPKSANDG
jgi:hypothetical protein